MTRNLSAWPALAATLILAGCAGAKNTQTVKSADYAMQPQEIAAVITSAPSLDPRFKEALADSVARCGAKLAFVESGAAGQPINIGTADSILSLQELGHETSTLTKYGAPTGPSHVSMVRMVFTLTDVKSKKQVWKAQTDLFAPQSMTLANPTPYWGDSVAELMQKDGLFQKCNFSRPAPTARR